MLTVEMLRQLLDYDLATGVFTWKHREETSHFLSGWNKRFSGKVAGRSKPNAHGYLEIAIDGVLYFSHRLAWLYVTGAWPEDQIDHVNLDKVDNRFENLREATGSANAGNTRAHKRNKIGLKGVHYYAPTNKYVASIGVGQGRVKKLGYFKTPEAAHEAYKRAAEEYFGEFARVA
jgi:hypothetical protein